MLVKEGLQVTSLANWKTDLKNGHVCRSFPHLLCSDEMRVFFRPDECTEVRSFVNRVKLLRIKDAEEFFDCGDRMFFVAGFFSKKAEAWMFFELLDAKARLLAISEVKDDNSSTFKNVEKLNIVVNAYREKVAINGYLKYLELADEYSAA